jgi:hypothetical protein
MARLAQGNQRDDDDTTTPPLAPWGHATLSRPDLRRSTARPVSGKGKYPNPRSAPVAAVFQHGHWAHGTAPEGAHPAECPACHRIRDKQPAGYLTLTGALVEGDRDELVRIARNVEKRETAEHPLHRIMAIEKDADRVLVTTTDVHLPQRIGEAVRHAHKGTLEIAYGHDDYAVRATWRK